MMEWAEQKDGLAFGLVTAFLLLMSIAGRAPGLTTSVWLLAVGVVLFGLPHGALDSLVARRVMGTKSLLSVLVFFIAYTFVAALDGLVWWWSPGVALASFLCISAFHFGTDWERRGNLLTRCAYGLAIVTLPVLRHAPEVERVYAVLASASTERLLHLSQLVAIPAASMVLLAAVAHWQVRRRDLLEFVCILGGALFLSPLLYFSCYFCFLHSPRHLFETAREEGLTSIAAIGRAAAPATLAPVLLAIILYVRAGSVALTDTLLHIVFVGLAVLTVPHMMLQAMTYTHEDPLT